MFLPGISGAFILLIMGMYKFMLDVLHDITGNIGFFLMFLFGAGLGAFTISHLIAFLFKKDRCKTLYVLLGLVIGALSIPVKEVVSGGNLDVIMGIFLISGFLSVTLVGKFVKVENGTE
jgi:putative membrane protein